jgi:hypothetical protein
VAHTGFLTTARFLGERESSAEATAADVDVDEAPTVDNTAHDDSAKPLD